MSSEGPQPDDPQLQNRIQSLFDRARRIEPEAPAFLETRVLAALREQEGIRLRRSLSLWRGFSAISALAAVSVLAWVGWYHRGEPAGGLSAPVDRAVVVRLEWGDLPSQSQIARIQIDLPSGVHFYSKDHRELESSSSAVLSVEAFKKKPYVPFAIRSEQAGAKPILVRFLDAESRVVGERMLDVRFKEGA